MWIARLKTFVCTVWAVFLSLVTIFFVQCLHSARFSEAGGKSSFYLYSPSSQAIVKEKISPMELFSIEGESVVFPCTDREKTLERVLQTYGAEMLFEECAGGSISYYCFTPKWVEGVCVRGKFVNLHIAFHGEFCALGSPIIFGGF